MVLGEVVISGIFGDDDHHGAIVVVAMAEGFLTLVQLVEIVFVPIPFNHVKTVQVEALREELEDVCLLGFEITAGEESQKRHRQVFAIAPLEVVDSVQASATAALDLQKKVCSLSHDNYSLVLLFDSFAINLTISMLFFFSEVSLSFHVINEQIPGSLQLIVCRVGIEAPDGLCKDVERLLRL